MLLIFRLLCVVLVFVVFLPGCGESGPATPPTAPGSSESPATPESGPVTTPESAPDATPAPPDSSAAPEAGDSIEARLSEVRRLQREGEVRSAQILVQVLLSQGPGPEHATELVRLERELNEQRDLEARMRVPLQNLSSSDPEVVRVARVMLRRAGDGVLPLLRKVVRQDVGSGSHEALLLLADLGDASAMPLLVDRYRADSQGPEAAALLAGITRLVRDADAAYLAGLQRDFNATPSDALADVLIVALVNRTDGDPAGYDQLVGDAEGHQRLRRYVEERMRSDDEAAAAWGQAYASVLGIAQPGLRVRYFEGTNFEKQVDERRVDVPLIQNGKYPLKRSENVSAKWTGQITVPRAGKYTFYPTADDGQRVMINGKTVVDDWRMQSATERSGSIELAAGVHDFEAQWMQGGGPYEFSLQWEGPGIKKQPVPATVFTVKPWPGMKD